MKKLKVLLFISLLSLSGLSFAQDANSENTEADNCAQMDDSNRSTSDKNDDVKKKDEGTSSTTVTNQ